MTRSANEYEFQQGVGKTALETLREKAKKNEGVKDFNLPIPYLGHNFK